MRSVFACLSVSFALAFSAEAAVQVNGTAQGVTLPPTCTLASPARLEIASGRYFFTCAETGLDYQCTQNATTESTFTTGSPNQTLSVNCTNAIATGLIVSATFGTQERGNGAGGVCPAATDVSFDPEARELAWTCGGYQGLCEIAADSAYDLANKRIAVICNAPAPAGVASASPTSVGTTAQTLITVAVTPADPAGTNTGVVANLSAIGGGATQVLADDGLNGDAAAADGTYSFRATVAAGTPSGVRTLPITVSDTFNSETRSSTTSTSVTVLASTNPAGTGTPVSAARGGNALLAVTVTPGISPPSTNINVQAISSVLGPSAIPLFDNGTNGDILAGDNVYSANVPIAVDATPGAYSVPVVIFDHLARSSSTAIALTIQAPTNPTATGGAMPANVARSMSTLLTVTVVNGTSPTSSGLGVTGNLGAIGGSTAQPFFDDGTSGDLVAGDRVFSYNATVTLGTTPGPKTVPVTVNDAQLRSGAGTINLTVLPPTDPTAIGTAAPSRVAPLDSTLLTIVVANGTSPTSTGITVTADLSAIGGAGSQAFSDSGTLGDAVADDGIYSYFVNTIPWPTPAGAKVLAYSVADAQGRGTNGVIGLDVLQPTDLGVFAVATPDNVEPDGTTLLTVTVTPGAMPNSSGITVTADLSGIGGNPAQAFLDDGQNGDVVAGDGVYSLSAVIATLTPTDPLTLPVDVTDAQGRSTDASFALSIVGSDDLAASGLATPDVVMGGDTTLLEVTVTPGDNPPSTAIGVGADLTVVGGSASQVFFDDATNGDATAGDNVFSYLLTLPAAPTPGAYRLPVIATDDETRQAQTGISLDVKGDPLFENSFD